MSRLVLVGSMFIYFLPVLFCSVLAVSDLVVGLGEFGLAIGLDKLINTVMQFKASTFHLDVE